MSLPRIVAVVGACGLLLSAQLATADDRAADFSSSGHAQASDVGYTLNQEQGNKSGGDCCSSCGCGTDCDCCGECFDMPRWRWTAGVEATYMDIVLRGGPSIGMDAGPRVWLGVENCNGWGFRARYWQIGATDFTMDVVDPVGPGTSGTDLFHLDLYTIDGELTKRGDFGDWGWLAFFGGRYASYQTSELFDIFDPSGPTSDNFATLIHAQAGGFTTGLELIRPVGGTLAAYGNMRVSVLWGDTDSFHVDRTINSGTPNTNTFATATGLDMTIWEAQVGLQCSKYVECCQGTVFARCGFEYQGWNLLKRPQAEGLPLNSLDLFGVVASIGITR